jgi:hypothetical protein
MSDFDRRAHVNRLLAELGYVLGDPQGLELDDEDRCVLGAGDAFAIDLFFNRGRGTLLAVTIVGELNLGDRVPFLTELLRANLYWRGTEGATLSLGPEDHVLLHRELPVEASLDLPQLRQALDSLIEVTLAWNRYLQDHQPVLGPPSEPLTADI